MKKYTIRQRMLREFDGHFYRGHIDTTINANSKKEAIQQYEKGKSIIWSDKVTDDDKRQSVDDITVWRSDVNWHDAKYEIPEPIYFLGLFSRSDPVIVIDDMGSYHVAEFQNAHNGSNYRWVDINTGMEILTVEKWCKIPKDGGM